MSTFIITGAGHSGTAFLARELNRAPGWTVEHEPDKWISAKRNAHRFANRDNYGEVNSYLLTSVRRIPAARAGVLLRNPYEILKSIVRSGWEPREAQFYVREAISLIDDLCRRDYTVIKFSSIISDPKAIARCASEMGILSFDVSTVDLSCENHHEGAEREFALDWQTEIEFNDFIRTYEL